MKAATLAEMFSALDLKRKIRKAARERHAAERRLESLKRAYRIRTGKEYGTRYVRVR